MREGTRTVVATLVAAMVIVTAVAAVVPFLNDDDGVRTGYFDRFPRDFGPGEKDYGTPEEAYAEFRKVLDANRPVVEDPQASDEAKENARDLVLKAYHVLSTKESLFMADYYYDTAAHGGEYQGWQKVLDQALTDYYGILEDDPQELPEEILDELDRLYWEEVRLIGEYTTAVAECSVIYYEGEQHNIMDWSLPDEVRSAAARVMSDRCGPLMLELADVRNSQAELLGYDSYADYAFHDFNSDDLTIGEVRRLTDFIVGNYETLHMYVRLPYVGFPYEKAEDLPRIMSPFLNEVSGDFGRLLDYLMDNDLFYSDPDPVKYPICYSIELPSHGSSLIYIGPPYNDVALVTAIHEFGHAAYSCLVSDRIGNKDIHEIHSHGLQLLAAGNAKAIVPERGDEFALLTTSTVLDNLLTMASISHIEAMLYDGTLKTTDDIVNELKKVYGTSNGLSEYLWCINSQIFEYPFYSSSYVTAIMTSFEILIESLEDWDSAADRYLRLLSSDAVGYRAVIADAGLSDILDGYTAARVLESVIWYMYELAEEVYGPFPNEVRVNPATSEVLA